ncbi:MAG: 1,4-dihydroxy-2-naphthoate polyprenyltransferase [Pseudomonadota bacterium]
MSGTKPSIKTWVLGARPKTLTAAVVPVLVATALAATLTSGEMRWGLSLFALLSSIFIQIGTNLFNDALDFIKGADTSERLGPLRVTQSGLLTPRAVWLGGLVCFGIASLLALPLLYAGGWPIFVIGICSLVAGYFYTGGPFPLAYAGLGDLFVLVFFGWIAVGGLFYLLAGEGHTAAFVAGTQVGLTATALIAINNLRDYVSDRKAGKRTLAVRFGPRFAKFEIVALLTLPILGGGYWWFADHPWAGVLPLWVLPLALRLVRQVRRSEPGRQYNSYLAQASLIHLLFGVLLSAGLLMA